MAFAVLVAVAAASGPRLLAMRSISEGFTNFETEPVRPLALSPDGTRLFALNTADDRLAIFAVNAQAPVLLGEVVVGLRPVAVAARSNDEVWVTNHLSDSVSVVDVSDPTAPRVVRTLQVDDEPRDIVFAGQDGNRAFVATARREQDNVSSVGRANVWVFDANDPGNLSVVTLFGLKPRGLAVSADGLTVYAAVFKSGNRTTTIDERTVRARGSPTPPAPAGRLEPAPPATFVPRPLAGSMPTRFDAPSANRRDALSIGLSVPRQDPSETPVPPPATATPPVGGPTPTGQATSFRAPPVSVIAQGSSGPRPTWRDETGVDWTDAIPFDLPDEDVFVIDAAPSRPVVVGAIAGVGTVLFNMAVQPGTGDVWVTNTESRNVERFEPRLRARAVDSRVSRLVGGRLQPGGPVEYTVVPVTLNPHIDATLPNGSPEEVALSLSQPVDIAFNADGSRAYMAAFGSRKVGVLDGDGAVVDRIDVGFGPGGVALDEAHGRLFVLNHLDATLSVVDLATREVMTLPLAYDPTPAIVHAGRPLLYDAALSSAHGDQSCASCHVFGDMDMLAWDLGDPDGDIVQIPFDLTHDDFVLKPRDFRFHPLKGPMMTQSLRGLKGTGPFHWRGDRFGPDDDPSDDLASFMKFQPAFESLLGRAPVADADMEAYARFVLTMQYPPNPNQNFHVGMTPQEREGMEFFTGDFKSDSGVTNCVGCHELPTGTNRRINFEGDRSGQDFKVPQLRNLYEKVGRFDLPARQVSGYGFGHDGSTDTILAVLSSELFVFPGVDRMQQDTVRRKVEQFILAFDTGIAPAVGRQLTLADGQGRELDWLGAVGELAEHAAAGGCELVAHQRFGSEERGWLLAGSRFQPDRRSEAALTIEELVERAHQPEGELTFTCVPPGDGLRGALDRDQDGSFNGDERDAGTDPADSSSHPIPGPSATPTRGSFHAHLPSAGK